MVVIMYNPYTGGTVTASVSTVERLARLGWEVETLSDVPAPTAPRGQVAEPAETGHATVVDETAGVERPHNGASRKAWAAYAESLGIEPGTLNRGELIAAVDAL